MGTLSHSMPLPSCILTYGPEPMHLPLKRNLKTSTLAGVTSTPLITSVLSPWPASRRSSPAAPRSQRLKTQHQRKKPRYEPHNRKLLRTLKKWKKVKRRTIKRLLMNTRKSLETENLDQTHEVILCAPIGN